MATYRLWPSTDGPGSQAADTDNYTLAVEFYVTQSGCTLTQIHFWASGTVTGSDHFSGLYQVTGANTGTPISDGLKAFASPLTAGWNTVTLDTPVSLTANQRYRASVYFTTDNGYTATGSYWSSGAGASGITNGPLVAPNSTDATDNDQGSFNPGGDAYPSSSFGAGNYWVDVTIDDGAGGGTDADAGHASGTGAAAGAAVVVSPVAGSAAGTGTANAVTAAAAPVAGNASGTGAAAGATGSVSSSAGNASGTGAAGAPAAAVSVSAGHAAGTGAAHDAAVSTADAANAAAGHAAGTGAALAPTVAIGAGAGVATGTGAANDPGRFAEAGAAAGTGAALTATPNVGAAAGVATGTGSMITPLIIISASVGVAAGTGSAWAATVPAPVTFGRARAVSRRVASMRVGSR